MINVLVIEDCQIQRKSLIQILLKTGYDFKIYEADSENQSLEVSKNVDIDLFFVDIDLNGSSGLEFALKVREIDKYKLTWIIFTTVHKSYMIQGFKKAHCYDYILKPYDQEKIIEVTKTIVENDIKQECKHSTKKKVTFKSNGIDIVIATSDIIFLEITIRNCIINTKFGQFKISRLSLKKALEIIDESFIIKSHKSFAININYITKIEKYSVTSWNVYFKDYANNALIGLKYKQTINNALNIT